MLKHALTILALTALPALAAAQTTDKLVDKYTALAGSKDNAKALVTGLRDGGDIKLGSETIKTPAGKMGVGNVNIALALTEASLDKQGVDKPTAKQLNAALTDILQQRADHKGWGEIAKSMDMKLGDVMRHERVARLDKPERAEKQERMEKPERPERPDRPGKGR